MPKSLEVSPSRLNQKGRLPMPDVPLYAYSRSIEDERTARSDATLKDVLRHMLIVREFETMLGMLRAQGKYADTELPTAARRIYQ